MQYGNNTFSEQGGKRDKGICPFSFARKRKQRVMAVIVEIMIGKPLKR
jgi:hypothetical protein